MKKIIVIDGQGGRIGAMLVSGLINENVQAQIIAVGTNSAATSAMLKAGAENGATGENPAIYVSGSADVITGPIGIINANALLGEITPKMSAAISESSAPKVLIPVNKCSISIAGIQEMSMTEYVGDAIKKIKDILSVI